jgi:hypothetical protein
MIVRVLATARSDLVAAYSFYKDQQAGLGDYFLTSIYADLARLELLAGVHRKIPGSYHRTIARRFPFAIYHRMNGLTAEVRAILDCRRSPDWIARQLRR